MTVYTHCPGGCGQPLLWPTDTPELCNFCLGKEAHFMGQVVPAPAFTLPETAVFFDSGDVTFTSVSLYDAAVDGWHLGTVEFHDDGSSTFIPPVEPPAPTLFGGIDDEGLDLDIDSALEHQVDRHVWDDNAPLLAGHTFEVEVCEFSVFARGSSPDADIPDGVGLAEHLVERFWEDCGFEDAYESMWEAAHRPAVIEAFQVARDLLVSYQTFYIADKVIATHKFKITITDEHGNWDSEPVQ